MKKILALLLAVVMCFGILAACGEADAPPPPPPPPPTPPTQNDPPPPPVAGKSDRQLLAEQYGLPYDPAMDAWEPITFTYFVRNANEPPAADNPIIKIVEEITNVKIDFQFNLTDLDTAMGVMLAGGDVPDMAFFGGEAAAAIDSGHFMPIDDLIDQYAPRLRAHYDPWWGLMKHSDGRIYTAEIYGTPVGTQTILWQNQSAFWLQKDVLDHYGRAPKDIDEYFDFIRGYKDLNPTIDGVPTVGFAIESFGWQNFGVANSGYFLAGNANWGGAVNTGGDHFDAPITPANRWTADFNKSWWGKLNEEFHLGTFSAETFTLTHDEYLAQIATGVVLGMHDQGWNFSSGEQPLIAEGRYERTYLPLALTYGNAEPNYLDARSFTGSNGINISANISDPIRAIQYLDWIIDESVQRFLEWGIEGEHYYYDDNGRIARPQEQRELQNDQRWGYDNLGRMLRDQMPKMQGSYPSDDNPTDPSQSPEEYFAGLTGYDRELFAKLGIYSMSGFWGEPKPRPPYYPYWSMNPADGSEAQLAGQRIDDIVRGGQVANMIIAPQGEFEAHWAAYLDAINAIDQKPIMDFFAEEAARRMAAFGG